MTQKRMIPVRLLPGLYTEATQEDSKNRWVDGMNVRFRKDWPEKVGGCTNTVDDERYPGACRQLFEWTALDDSVWTAIGTHSHLYLYSNTAMYDITPLDEDAPSSGSGTLGANPFTTTNGSAVVNVEHAAHGRLAGDFVVFDGASAVGGITLDGEYDVTEVIDTDNYTVTHSAAATSAATGGGAAVTFEYLLPTGNAAVTAVTGYGAGVYSHAGGYGMPAPTEAITQEPRLWVFDKWGEDLVAGVRGGKIFTWDRSAGTVNNRATRIANSPDSFQWLLVSDNRQLLVFGANDGSSDDPLLIVWTDEEDFTDFTPSDTNAAGDLRLDSGSKIMTALHGKSEKVVFTDSSVYAFRFRGAPYYWGKDPLSQNVRLIGPNAAVMVEGVCFAMMQEDFAIYDGVFRTLPCDIRNAIFDDFNRDLASHVYAGVNSDFTEVWWFYPSGNATDNDRVAIYNYVERTWSLANFARTAWHDSSPQFGKPYAVNADVGILYKHETGKDNDTEDLDGYIESYFFEIGEGDDFLHVDRLVPDFLRATGTVEVTLRGKRYEQEEEFTEKGPYAVTSTTQKIGCRLRRRLISLRVDFSGSNTDFRMGAWKMRAGAHGKR